MKVNHHLDDVTLLRYASGNLDEAFLVVVASHLALCDVCRVAVRAAESIGGCLLEDIDGAQLSEGAFERLMGSIDKEGDQPAAASAGGVAFEPRAGEVPLPLRRFVGPSLDTIRWKRVAPGVRKHTIKLPSKSTSSLYMLEIAADKAVPEHGHGGAEITLILTGAYNDHLGRFCAGDVADLDEHIEHQPKVERGAPCICLVATERPTRFKGLISRVLQPLHGI